MPEFKCGIVSSGEGFRGPVHSYGAIAALARHRQADFVLVAGDVLDDNGLRRDDLQQTADALRCFGDLPVSLLPGNHDAATADSDRGAGIDDRGIWPLIMLSQGESRTPVQEHLNKGRALASHCLEPVELESRRVKARAEADATVQRLSDDLTRLELSLGATRGTAARVGAHGSGAHSPDSAAAVSCRRQPADHCVRCYDVLFDGLRADPVRQLARRRH